MKYRIRYKVRDTLISVNEYGNETHKFVSREITEEFYHAKDVHKRLEVLIKKMDEKDSKEPIIEIKFEKQYMSMLGPWWKTEKTVSLQKEDINHENKKAQN